MPLDPNKYKQLGQVPSPPAQPTVTTPPEEQGFWQRHPDISRFLFGQKEIQDPNTGKMIPINTPGWGSEPLIPRIKDFDSNTYAGMAGNFAQDLIRGGISTPEGLIGAAAPGRISYIGRPRQLPAPREPIITPPPGSSSAVFPQSPTGDIIEGIVLKSEPLAKTPVVPTPTVTIPTAAPTLGPINIRSFPGALKKEPITIYAGGKYVKPTFLSDVDKALYQIGEKTSNKDQYLSWLKDRTGLSDDALNAASKQLRTDVKNYFSGKKLTEDVLDVPTLHTLTLPKPTPKAAPVVAPTAPKVVLGQAAEVAPKTVIPQVTAPQTSASPIAEQLSKILDVRSANLPKHLAGGKPGYSIGDRKFIPQFEDDIDKALLIISDKKAPSKRNVEYVEWLTNRTGLGRAELEAAAKEMRSKLKIYLTGQKVDGEIPVPRLHGIRVPTVKKTSVIPEATGPINPNLAPQIEPTVTAGPTPVPPSSTIPPVDIPPNIPPNTPPPPPPTTPIPPPISPQAPIPGRGLGPKRTAADTAIKAANIPKALQSGLDISYQGRQGLWFLGRKEWWKSWKPMIKALKSDEFYQANKAEIAAHPRFADALENGLGLTEFDPALLPKRIAKRVIREEEQGGALDVIPKFISKWTGAEASGRAFNAAANNMRMNLYDNLVSAAEKSGATFDKRMIAEYINSGSGRGSMGVTVGQKVPMLEKASEILNLFLYSPRFQTSRFQLLNPFSYAKMDPFLRKQYLRDLGTFAGVSGGVLGLLDASGVDVDWDSESKNFLKAKVGNTYVDLLAGMGPWIRLMSQASNAAVKGDKGPDLGQFAEGKLSPAVRGVMDVVSGTDFFGKEQERWKGATQIFVPLILKDIYELWKDDPNSVPLGIIPGVGGSIQTYQTKKKNKRSAKRRSTKRSDEDED